MRNKIIIVVIFFTLCLFLIYYLYRNDSASFDEFCKNIENKLPDIENINFKYFRYLSGQYVFTQDTFDVDLNYNVLNRLKVYDNRKHEYCELDEYPESFYKDFDKIKRICDDLNIYYLCKDSLNMEIEFIFEIKHVITETIPGWNRELESKSGKYDGYIIYDFNNKLEEDINYHKLKDKWYFEYHERRPN